MATDVLAHSSLGEEAIFLILWKSGGLWCGVANPSQREREMERNSLRSREGEKEKKQRESGKRGRQRERWIEMN